jgi:hypothetical protein
MRTTHPDSEARVRRREKKNDEIITDMIHRNRSCVQHRREMRDDPDADAGGLGGAREASHCIPFHPEPASPINRRTNEIHPEFQGYLTIARRRAERGRRKKNRYSTVCGSSLHLIHDDFGAGTCGHLQLRIIINLTVRAVRVAAGWESCQWDN